MHPIIKKAKKVFGFNSEQSKRDSYNAHVRNFNKHIRIANATRNLSERQVHIDKAQKLAKRYGFKVTAK